MIINSNLHQEQSHTIDYIRNLTNYLSKNNQKQLDKDSLVVSDSEESISMTLIIPTHKKKKKKSKSQQTYISPYKQDKLSIQKIMKSKKKNHQQLFPFTNLVLQDYVQPTPPKSKSPNKIAESKYRHIPSLIQKMEKHQVEKMKIQARLVYQKNQRAKEDISERQKKQKWANFLLRERRWEQKKESQIRVAQQDKISKEKQFQSNITPKNYPKMNIEDHIRLVKKKKHKLEEQLKELTPNYYTWRNHSSPLQRRSKSPLPPSKSSREKTIHLSNQKQLSFLIKH